MLKFSHRMLVYFVATLALGAYYLYDAIVYTQENMDRDPSAAAWMAFLPYAIPLVLVSAVLVVWPFALLNELAIALWEKFGKQE